MTAKEKNTRPSTLPAWPGLDGPPEERPDFASTLRVVDYLEELWRWKYLLALVCFCATLGATLYAITRMNTYKSESRLMVTAPRQGINADTALGLSTAHMRFSPTDAVMELFHSEDLIRRTLRKVVDELPLYKTIMIPVAPSQAETASVTNPIRRPLVKYTHDLWRSWAASARSELEGMGEDQLMERAIRIFRSGLTLRANMSSATVIATFRCEDPVKAHTILKTFVQEGMQYYIQRNSALTLGKAMEGLIDKASQDYYASHRKLEQFLQKLGVSDYQGHMERLLTQIEDMEAEIRASRARLEGLRKESTRLANDLQQMKNDEFIPAPTQNQTVENPDWEALRNIYIELKQRIEAERSPTERERLSKLLARKKAEMDKLDPFITTKVRGQIRNPAYTEAETSLIGVKSEIRSIESRLAPREQSLASFKKKMNDLLAKQPEWDRLHSDMLRKKAQKDDLNTRHQRVELSRNLDRQGISNLSLVDQDRVATLEPVKEGPSRLKFILAGFGGSLACGAVLIMLLLRVSTRITRGAQLEKILGIAVPAQVPKLTKTNLKRALRARALGWD